MEERELTKDESFDLIIKMIHNARTNLRAKINSRILLLWGYMAVGVSLILFALNLVHLNFNFSSLLWLSVPLVSYPFSLYLVRKEKMKEKTFLDRLIDYITILFVILCIIVAFSTLWVSSPVFYIEGLLISTWIIIIGLMVKYKKIIGGGIIGIILSHTLLFITSPSYQTLLFASILITTIIIPGHLFKSAISKK